MLKNLFKAPFPWFGGKSDAAPVIWEALGDPAHYVEPFAGSLAVLMRRPAMSNRAYYSETVNDFDGLLVNAWRAIQFSPSETADAASWPVSEADLHARHVALLEWKREAVPRLMGDPTWHDPVMAGWWMWGQSSWIGSGWCSGEGPWYVDERGCFVRRVGRGRGEGVSRQLPHLGNDGQGVNHAGTREEGVSRQRPHLGNDGQGVNRPGTREEGVGDFHAMTMPELLRWFEYLSARLRHVRILCGDWKRACTGGAMKTIPVRSGKGVCGVFLDPPYTDTRTGGLYAHDDLSVAHEVREWCATNGGDPSLRIVLAGFDGEHESLVTEHGWREVEWYRSGFLKGGMANASRGKSKRTQKRERLWMSPHCIATESPDDGLDAGPLFGKAASS